MERKVKEEQRIEREALAFSTYKQTDGWSGRAGVYDMDKYAAYIAGATRESERNKEDAIGFAEWTSDNEFKYLGDNQWLIEGKTIFTEQLYEIYKSGL